LPSLLPPSHPHSNFSGPPFSSSRIPVSPLQKSSPLIEKGSVLNTYQKPLISFSPPFFGVSRLTLSPFSPPSKSAIDAWSCKFPTVRLSRGLLISVLGLTLFLFLKRGPLRSSLFPPISIFSLCCCLYSSCQTLIPPRSYPNPLVFNPSCPLTPSRDKLFPPPPHSR